MFSGRLAGITIKGDLLIYIYIYASNFVLSVNFTTWGASAVDHTETLFSGRCLTIECVIRISKMNHGFIYIDRVFWKINRDNNQWVGYHQLSAKCSRLAVIIFVYSAGHLLRTENPLLRTNIITLRTENPLLRTNIITLRTENPLLRTHFVIYILF